LKAGAVVSQLADAVEAEVNNLLADSVMATSEVVGSILFATDELLRVEELAIGASADLINHGGLEVKEDAAGHMLAGAGLAEKGVESVVTTADGLVGGHLPIRLDAVLKAVELPAGVASLDAGLLLSPTPQGIKNSARVSGWRFIFLLPPVNTTGGSDV
jgi:hypothetical protein